MEKVLSSAVLTPRFPLHLTDEEGAVHDLPHALAVQQDLEFWDDYQGDYVCISDDGRRVRLIVWNLMLLVCQHVPQDYHREDLYVASSPFGPAGNRRFCEMHRETALRCWTTLYQTEATVSVEPARWEDGTPSNPGKPVRIEAGTDEEVCSFHRRWMSARLGDRFP
jgi:hypothetical protein